MLLKNFSAHGFKSFADKVTIDFEPGITAIVGPNGSGKSNISDAICWVMGEQSIRSLRGTKMEDVIFTGSPGRRAMGMAEVTLTFDNTDRTLPLDFDAVSFCRRVYRSGESEYFINQKSCRLKDVVALLADTGLGRGSMSVIGQNKIDEILNSRPEERRSIFEEAAGIAKYRIRKKEALRKLDETGSNLLRIRDIEGEIASQLDPLEKAAEKARQYALLQSKLRQVRITRSVNQLDQLEQEQQQLAQALAEKEQEGQALSARLAHIQQETTDLEAAFQEKEQVYTKAQEETAKQQQRAAALYQQQAVLAERSRGAKTRQQQLLDRHKSLEAELAKNQEALDAVTEAYDAQEKAQQHAKAILTKWETEKNSLTKQVQDVEQAEKAYQEQAFEAMRTLVMTRNALTTARHETDCIHRQLEQMTHTLEAAEQEAEELKAQAKNLEEGQHAGEARKEQLLSKEQAAKTELAGSVKTYQETNARLQTVQNQWNQQKARLQVLTRMEAEHEGFSRGVKTVLSAHAPFQSGICGAVADLFGMEKRYVPALEMALGGALQNIITEDDGSARQAIGYLKQVKGGRATFLPLNTLRPRPLSQWGKAVQKEAGILGIAAEFVQTEDRLRPAVEFLLGQVLIADTLDHAMAAAKKADMRVRIVTLEGDVISPGGSLSGGEKQQSRSFLSRKQEIQDLTASGTTLQREQKQLTETLEQLTETGKQQRALLETIQQQRQQLDVQQAGIVANLQQIRQQQTLQQKKNELLRQEKNEAVEALTQAQETAARLLPQVKVMEAQNTAGEEASRERAEAAEKLRLALEQAARNHQDALVALSSVQSQVETLNGRIQSIDQMGEKISGEIRDGEKSYAAQQQILEDNQKQQETISQQLVTLEETLKQTGQYQETYRKDRQAYLAQKDALRRQETQAKESVAAAEQALHRMELEQVKKSGQVEQEENKLRENYDLELEGARKEALTDVSEEQLRKTEKAAAGEVEAMGPVNPNAPEEYQAAKERYDFLHRQVEDLTQAKQQLETVIHGINTDMGRRFQAAFSEINTYFNQCYVKLFGGGKARLRLTEEASILEAGVEIEVQPPGKKMRNLQLFSGGERALTVIALLFALLSYQPAPFVILDEIDAPLDESNIDRFAQFLKEYGRKTQFIVITHRKGTMEAADVLHGITMEEAGVSRILSVKLSEAIKQ